MGEEEKKHGRSNPRRRNSTSRSGPTRSNSTQRMDGFGEIATRRRSAGGGAGEGGGGDDPFDPFAVGNAKPASEKKSSNECGDAAFDPFSTTAIDRVMAKKKAAEDKAASRGRRAPQRSASTGKISKSDLMDFEKSNASKDSDLQFDDVDWDGTAAARFQSRPRARPTSTSRRHSMDSAQPTTKSKEPSFDTVNEDDGFGAPIKHSKGEKKGRGGKSRRQSLDSALAKKEEEADGFGEVKTYGYETTSVVSGGSGSEPSGRGSKGARRGSTGRQRMSGDAGSVTMDSWNSGEKPSGGGRRTRIPRRRSADNAVSSKSDDFDAETTVTNTTSTSAESMQNF